MKHQNSVFPKLRDFWVSDLVLLLIGYILILNVQCMLLHIFTAGEQTFGLPKADFYPGRACKAKICPLIPRSAVTNTTLPHSPPGPHFKNLPLTLRRRLMGFLRPRLPRWILRCPTGIPDVNVPPHISAGPSLQHGGRNFDNCNEGKYNSISKHVISVQRTYNSRLLLFLRRSFVQCSAGAAQQLTSNRSYQPASDI